MTNSSRRIASCILLPVEYQLIDLVIRAVAQTMMVGLTSGNAVAAKRGTERKRAGEAGRMAFAVGNSHTARHAGKRIDPFPA